MRVADGPRAHEAAKTASVNRSHTQTSPWSPLHEPFFRGLWMAALGVNFGLKRVS